LLTGVRGALSFLTIVPVGGAGELAPTDFGRGVVYFPLVGAAVGGLTAATAWAASFFLPTSLSALFAVAVGVLLTGAMHVDGLADTADGYGGRSRARALEIMRDHSIGSYGAVAVVLDIGLRTAAVAALLPSPNRLLYLIAAGALSRAAAVGLGVLLPNARAHTGQAALLEGAGLWRVGVAIVTAVALAALLCRWPGILGAAGVGAVAFLWGWHCLRRLGGMTGDTLGAMSEAGEVLVVVVGAAVH
jgi:cobalamin 5'-phosphate synthase/cobalamin synthase